MTDELLGIFTEEIQKDGKDSFHFHRYEPTPYEVLDRLFEWYTPQSKEHVVDYGCGLGRMNFYLEKRFGIYSTGVEMVNEYYKRALENKQHYNGNRDRIHFVCCKAEEYSISVEDTVFYFFNPFSVDIFRKVINKIIDSYEECPREITLILYYPEDDTIFYLENHTSFCLADEVAACDDIRKDRRERFGIYRISASLTQS